jgi:hypothetical protein
MNKIKLIVTLGLTLVVLFAQTGPAAAAPQIQDSTLITGIITGIALDTDTNGVITVLVTLDNLGTVQTVRISVDTAFELGLLVTLDPPTVDGSKINSDTTVEIDSDLVITDEEVSVHPLAALLAGFFGEEASVINEYHTDGFGFGVIAQALWMSQNLNDDASLAGQILDAKESGDYSAFTLADGTVPTNWGQFRKAVLNKKNNLGIIVSGQVEDPSDLSTQQEHGNGNRNENGHGNGNGNSQNQNKGKDK